MDRFTLWVGSYPHPFFQGGLGTNAAQEEGEMKLQIRYRVRRIIATICSMGVVCCGQLFVPASGVCRNSVADEIISLNVIAQPLGEVLKTVSSAIDCRFSIDGSWEDYPVTASFQNKPLHAALKSLLRKVNNAIIYDSERHVKILIYDTSAEKNGGRPVFIGASEGRQPSFSSAQEAITPEPEAQMPEEGSPPDFETTPTETDESDSESVEAENESEAAREKPDEQALEAPTPEDSENTEDNQQTN